ncbi:MAG: hypothetical protein KVP17_002488 [Porospora cf. gigantea B]|nr:MAG: hypothetical protein KVP17_002488 [Porospora cf. gigantea B]
MRQLEPGSDVCGPEEGANVTIGSSVANSCDKLREYTSAQEAEEDLKCRLSVARRNPSKTEPEVAVGPLHDQLKRARGRLEVATANLALADRHAIGMAKLNRGVELSTRAKLLLSDAHVLFEQAQQAREERRALWQVGVNADDSGRLFRFMLESDVVVGKHEFLCCLNLETSQMTPLLSRNGSHSKYESHSFCLGDFDRGRWSLVAVLKRSTLPTPKEDLLGIKGFRANSEFDISVADVPVRPDIYSILKRAEIFPDGIPDILAHIGQAEIY